MHPEMPPRTNKSIEKKGNSQIGTFSQTGSFRMNAYICIRIEPPKPAMEFRTPVHIAPFEHPINHRQKGLLLGSCFSEHIGTRMLRAKLPVTVNPFGILFNPASIAATLDRLHAGKPFHETDLIANGDLWVSLAHHGQFSSTDKGQALTRINRALEAGSEALAQADYLILTLGTAWIYRYKPTGEVAANCHKLPASVFERHRMEPEEIVTILEKSLSPYLNNKRLILTVSPVRHAGDGLIENQLSKATLIVAAARLQERHPDTTVYFPAYEILMDELRDYRFYQPDMMHPSSVAVEYIWERFSETAFDPTERELSQQIDTLNRAMEHRPINPDSEAHRTFRARMKTEAERLQREFPYLDFSTETAYFTD